MRPEQPKESRQSQQQAIVIGGSIAGMMAARVLSEHFQSVVVLDRDAATRTPEPHKSVPQGAHIHVLLSKGRKTLSRLFPGIFVDMQADGSLHTDSVQDMVWFHSGVWKARYKSGIDFFMQSRPLVDWHVRRRLLSDCPNVRIQNQSEVQELKASRDRIHSVVVRPRSGHPLQELECDLLVDASGRGTRMPRWLAEHGFDRPEEEKVVVNIGYTTRLYEQDAKLERDWTAMMIYPSAPEKRLGYIYPIEPGPGGKSRWIVTMAGAHGAHAPMTDEGFMEHARSLAQPHIYSILQTAKPISGFSAFKFPATRRLRYDRVRRLPENMVAVGDAMASFNPIYGQGMSIAAMGVEQLERCLRKGTQNLGRRFFRRAIWTVTAVPWLLVTAEDYRYPETEGRRPPGLSMLHWYLSRMNRLAAHDGRISAAFLRVLHFQKLPSHLFRPQILGQVLANALGLFRPRVNPNPEQDFLPLPPGEGMQARLRAARPVSARKSRQTSSRRRNSTPQASRSSRKTASTRKKPNTRAGRRRELTP